MAKGANANMSNGPYEAFFSRLLKFAEELSPCASAWLIAAMVTLVAHAIFAIAPHDSAESNAGVISTITKILCLLFIICFAIFHVITGLYPTFCIAKGARRINKELSKRIPLKKKTASLEINH